MKYLRRHIARTVVVTTTTDRAFRGTLAHADPDCLTLDRPTVLGSSEAALDGVLVVPCSVVLTVQVV